MNALIAIDDGDRPHRRNITWFSVVHLLAIVALCYLGFVRFAWQTVLLALVWWFLCHLTISAGAHRYYAHKMYRASLALRVFFTLYFPAVYQGHKDWWAQMHRPHHGYVDTDKDPHAITKGFWYAHMGWLLIRRWTNSTDRSHVQDLLRDPLLLWEKRHHYTIALVVGFLIPAALGALWGDILGAVLVAGFLRIAVQYHTTWAVNSFAHWFGDRPYTKNISARNSVGVALLTVGEGLHHNHHIFEFDYRFGTRWYHFDLGGWFIRLCGKLKLADVPSDAELDRRRELQLARLAPV